MDPVQFTVEKRTSNCTWYTTRTSRKDFESNSHDEKSREEVLLRIFSSPCWDVPSGTTYWYDAVHTVQYMHTNVGSKN